MRVSRADIRELTLERIEFKNGGSKPIVRLTQREWEAVTAQDPPQYAAALVTLFLEKNKINSGVLCDLMYQQARVDEERAHLYDTRRRFQRRRPIGDRCDDAMLMRVIKAECAVSTHCVVALADVLGMPPQLLLERGSAAALRYTKHQSRRSSESEVDERLRPSLERVRSVFADLPLRHVLSDAEMLELARRFKAALEE